MGKVSPPGKIWGPELRPTELLRSKARDKYLKPSKCGVHRLGDPYGLLTS